MARLGVPSGGRVRKLRAVEDQSAPIPEVRTNKFGGIISMDDGRSMYAVKRQPWPLLKQLVDLVYLISFVQPKTRHTRKTK
jgi:hypothetical protein